jgi:transposase
MTSLLSQLPLTAESLSRTPPEVIEILLRLLAENQALREENQLLRQEIVVLRARVEELEAQLNKNSSNSNKPPSSDSPFEKRPEKTKKAKKSRKRKGMRQQCLRPTELVELFPRECSCGCRSFAEHEPYYIHQVIETSEIKPEISHILLYRGRCLACGKTGKAHIPHEVRTGFGPRISALVAELAAVHGDSRRAVQEFLFSVLGIPVSQGAMQNILDRVSRAIAPHHEAIGEAVRSAPVNHIDETTWKTKHPPSMGQWSMFYARLLRLIGLYRDQADEAGLFVRRLQREMGCLWLFLQEQGVAPTNNHAERTYVLPCCGANAASETGLKRGNVLWSVFSPFGKHAVCKRNVRFLFWLMPYRSFCKELARMCAGFKTSGAAPRELLPQTASKTKRIRTRISFLLFSPLQGMFRLHIVSPEKWQTFCPSTFHIKQKKCLMWKEHKERLCVTVPAPGACCRCCSVSPLPPQPVPTRAQPGATALLPATAAGPSPSPWKGCRTCSG